MFPSVVYADVCSQLLSKQPRLLESIDDQLSDVVDIELSGHYVREHLNGKDPHSRQIIMKSQNNFRELTTTFYFNLENICPPELSKSFQCDGKLCLLYNIHNMIKYGSLQIRNLPRSGHIIRGYIVKSAHLPELTRCTTVIVCTK